MPHHVLPVIKKTEKWNFSNLGKRCSDCHENIHKTYFDSNYLAGDGCKNCHSVEVWNEVKFDHNRTDFKLQGKHAGLSCRECHFTKSEKDELIQQFNWENQLCTNCHEDIHYGQFARNGNADCEKCHTFENWKPEKFDHNDARFKLDGKHADLACAKCHKPGDELTKKYIIYKFEDISCKSCH